MRFIKFKQSSALVHWIQGTDGCFVEMRIESHSKLFAEVTHSWRFLQVKRKEFGSPAEMVAAICEVFASDVKGVATKSEQFDPTGSVEYAVTDDTGITHLVFSVVTPKK